MSDQRHPLPVGEQSARDSSAIFCQRSTYALAYTGLAGYYAFGAANGLLSPNENWPKAQDAIDKALALDDTLAEAHHGLAAIELYYKRDWPAAERAFRRGAELNPNNADIPDHYGLCLALFGRNQEALTQMARAAELDPFSPGLNLNRGKLLFFLRDYDRAIDLFNKTLELHPGYAAAHECLGDVYEKKGKGSEAIAEWSKALTLSGEGEHASIVKNACTASGFEAAVRTLAQKKLERLNERTDRGDYVPAMQYLIAYMRLGDKEQSFAWLAKTVEERNWFVFEIRVNPILDSLRDDPRFQKLAAEPTPKSADQ